MATDRFIDPREPNQLFYTMTVLAQDPSTKALDGNPLLAKVQVPADRITAGIRRALKG